MSARPAPRCASLLISARRGDVLGNDGYVNFDSDYATFQGLLIHCPEVALEYRVHWQDGSWSDWVGNDFFAGSRDSRRF